MHVNSNRIESCHALVMAPSDIFVMNSFLFAAGTLSVGAEFEIEIVSSEDITSDETSWPLHNLLRLLINHCGPGFILLTKG